MRKTKVFIIGGNGFIGSEIVKEFAHEEVEVVVPARNELVAGNGEKDIIIYCAGNGDCSKPEQMLDSNINYLQRVLIHCTFKKLIYLSSTRLYLNSELSDEDSAITIHSEDSRRLFNLTKLTAEECCLKSEKNTLIVRPSNVYGKAFDSKLFLPMIVKHAILNKKINMYVDKDYSKDYVSVSDVADVVKYLALNYNGNNDIFNIASGKNTTALELANIIQSKINCEVVWNENTTKEKFPLINISKINGIMQYTPNSVTDDLSLMIDKFVERFQKEI
ncbi:NAD(P)-dependent oxidoreductase [Citrobacter sp. Cpo142]|jgi:nucleoside-diphosphate-sugar epimerase|uniref:NAD-dependent epimerase/dehydratase family protein n=1 Tax=Citrobacter TaxID=544 RepID=UPI002574D31B|nr:NAD(P)-dependent oxidoreductase [Citrobacter sp. Cpo142]MDM2776596.1 NAD(P)-dependent oxidoreductase [Citrobacter sp. Cpo142]